MLLNRSPKIARKHTENKALILEAIRAYGTLGARGGATTLNVMYEVYLSYDQARTLFDRITSMSDDRT